MSSKFHVLHGGSTPQIFCAKLTEIADDIEHIACVIAYKDGTTSIANTAMNSGDIVWLRWVFNKKFDPDKIEDEENE